MIDKSAGSFPRPRWPVHIKPGKLAHLSCFVIAHMKSEQESAQAPQENTCRPFRNNVLENQPTDSFSALSFSCAS